ncbi:FAD-binding oxidoreductase [Glutamicibacter uratoxydans]|uniref:FAD-binding oxidoreductase n=1 Tax=Glutamicibacter uratoxydans TaxID=43667 RepID=UPI003D6E0EE1
MSTSVQFNSFLSKLKELLGSEGLVTDREVLLSNSRDFGQLASDPILPLAVAFAQSTEQVQAIMRLCTEFQVPVISRGAGTGVSGGVHVLEPCLVLNLSRMNRILEIRQHDEVAVVEPGVINSVLNDAVAEYGFMYAPDPASYKMSTIGGNIATNAGGLRCAKYGVTRESVLSLEIVLADGRLITVGAQSFKGVAGYDLTSLFVGSEGTLGVVVKAVVRLRYLPVDQRDLSMVFQTLEDALVGVQAIGRARVQPAILELIDRPTMEVLDRSYDTNIAELGEAMVLARFDGYGAKAEENVVRQIFDTLPVQLSAAADPFATTLIEMRRTSRGDMQDDAYRMGEDVAVPKSKMVAYVRQVREIAEQQQVDVRFIAHAGDGNLHPTFSVEPDHGGDPLARLTIALEESIRLALEAGGTITGEHGVGLIKREWLGWEQSETVLAIQRQLKDLLDPLGILNPGKAIQ